MAFDKSFFIVVFSAFAAAVSVIAFALPIVLRKEKKVRYKEVIEKKRKSLFEQAREQVNQKQTQKPELSAARSMAVFYRLQKLAGDASLSVRNMMLQAGIRNPNAPLYYYASRILLPIFLSGTAMMFISHAQKEVSKGKTAMILTTAILAGLFLPRILIKNTADKRQQEISIAFPDALDMMLICVQGGIGIEAAINRIADTISEHSQPLAEELGILSADMGMLNDRKEAFKGFAARVGSGPARSFGTAMIQAEQYGTSISKALRVLADESRDARMAAAEQKAASLPPKLTVPMILFFLPALFIVILGPAFIRGAGH